MDYALDGEALHFVVLDLVERFFCLLNGSGNLVETGMCRLQQLGPTEYLPEHEEMDTLASDIAKSKKVVLQSTLNPDLKSLSARHCFANVQLARALR